MIIGFANHRLSQKEQKVTLLLKNSSRIKIPSALPRVDFSINAVKHKLKFAFVQNSAHCAKMLFYNAPNKIFAF